MTERIYGDQNFRFDTASEAVFVTQVGADGESGASLTNPVTTGFSAAFTSPFGDLIAQPLTPLIQMDFVHGLNTQTSSTSIVTTGVADTSSGRLRLQTGTGAAGSAVFLSRRPAKYRPGQGIIWRGTTAYTTGVASSTQIHGIGNVANDAYAFGYNGTAFGILHRNASSDTWVAQTAWNGDKCDGTDASGFTWDKTKGNVCMIKYPYLGYGNITFWVQDSATSQFILCHTIRYTNSSASVQLSNPNLSSYAQVINSGNTTNVTMYVGSLSVFLCGERSFIGSPKWAADNSKAAITTETCILNIRNATTYNGVTNRSLIRLNSVSLSSTANNGIAVLRFKIGATIGGAPSYTTINGTTADNGVTITSGNSVSSVDTAGTTVTGGTYVFAINIGSPGGVPFDLEKYNIVIAPGETLTVSGFSTASTTIGAVVTWTEDI